MEGESRHSDPLQLMSLNPGGSLVNDVSDVLPEDNLNQNMSMAAGRNVDQTDPPFALPFLIQSPIQSQTFADFLAENTSVLSKSPYEDMLERISSSLKEANSVDGVSEYQRDLFHCSSLGKASGSNSFDLHMDSDSRKHHTFWADTFAGDNFDIDQIQKLVMAAPGFPSWPHQSAQKKKAVLPDRARRIRIAERVAALEQLLPQPVQGGHEFVLDDVIDHIKFLQLQIKDLSKSRLGGEIITEPLIFREGYGHYFLHQQMLSEPLEEMIGKLLETNPAAAEQLLKDKGLLMVPLDLTKKLL